MKKYILDFSMNQTMDASSKARDDISNIMYDEGFQTLYYNKGKNIFSKFYSYITVLLSLKFFSSIVLVQYPLNQKIFNSFIIKHFFPKNSIVLVHDIESIRLRKKEKDIIEEIDYLNNFKYKIIHNNKMKQICLDYNLREEIVELEIFDYLISDIGEKNNLFKKGIAFAGNLSIAKSPFLYDINNIDLHLYGNNFEEEKNIGRIIYKGKYPAEILPSKFNEKFGLVWDGTSKNECDQYLKYNNPHKFSLYIASYMPVIVWEKSAIADFVKKYNIGVVVGSLDELNNKILEISNDEYVLMQKNIKIIAERLHDGYFTKKSVNECIKMMEDK